MFNAQKLLGGLVRAGVARKTPRALRSITRGSSKALLGAGALGLAFAAYEHFIEDRGRSSTSRTGAAPPPPPAPSSGLPPPPPPTPQTAEPADGVQEEAMLLIRAMIAAAACDGHIDAQERERVLGRLEKEGFEEEARVFVLAELENPGRIDDIVSQTGSPEIARQVYAASILAIDVDTPEERRYLGELGRRLGLSADTLEEIEKSLSADDVVES